LTDWPAGDVVFGGGQVAQSVEQGTENPRGRLYFDSEPPYITCKERSTKNKQDARQHIQCELAVNLKAHIATKTPQAPIFNLPHETNLARMLRDDLAAARKAWLQEAKHDPDEYCRREQSDFLVPKNHDGEMFDFHSLRHTCGAWLSMTGAHPKVVQTVMRHSSITLTMDTYGHLFPGQEADAVGRLRDLLGVPLADALRATGTDDQLPKPAQRVAQQLGRVSVQSGATACNSPSQDAPPQKKSPKSVQFADSGDETLGSATQCQSGQGRNRTADTGIFSPLLYRLSYLTTFENNVTSRSIRQPTGNGTNLRRTGSQVNRAPPASRRSV